VWSNSPEPFTCIINAPEKKSKYKGMKSFIAYNITPSVSLSCNKKFVFNERSCIAQNRKYPTGIPTPGN